MVGPSRLILLLAASALLMAQATGERFKARLSPVSMDTAMKVNIAGSGSATATLTGSHLSISGSFEGLLSPAIKAQIHQGSATGVRGPAILDLKIPSATAGTVTGAFALTADQISALRKGRFYIEIASEKAPDGNLWGWLLQ